MSSSFKGYGKVDEADQARLDVHRRTRKRIAIIGLSTIVLVGVVLAAVLGTSHSSNGDSKSANSPTAISSSIKAVCKVTQYPDSCFSSLSSLANSTQLDPLQLFKLSLKAAMKEISSAFNHLTGIKLKNTMDMMSEPALSDCKELLGLAVDHVNGSLLSSDLSSLDLVDDLKTWLSATGTYLQTCIDGFANATKEAQLQVSNSLKNSTEFTSNSLAILTGIFNVVDSFKLRRLMVYTSSEFPVWVSSKDRKLLANPDPKKNADIVVAQDGSGKYKRIGDALVSVPDMSEKRTVIYVKKGVYKENVWVDKSKWNVMMVGDGMNATIVTGSKNVVDGTPTFSTATFAVFGKGFIARDMQFQNTAGAVKQQAVALMSNADQSVFYRCRFDGFQDTLYTHTNRQFYRECDVLGTVDFIFGNAAVVLQNCTIRPKVPMLGQQNTITAQGKIDPNQNTGISIHNCQIYGAGNLSSVRTYLGRPWKDYSTTVYMQSMLGSLIDPAGWLPWVGDSVPNTIFYSEFQNHGPGSSMKNRVKWKGLRSIHSKQAIKFTVKSFIEGDRWISEAGVPYKSGLRE
ncbi:putative pectinesterase/pectinesterase inhibitor 24 [Cinnamomum micranthum f. kanehirae]|uniref:Pectinesterase n=1 Tax=Cinnamomum micranthum f. kanehirae TaxID=337451 RepID=A0A443N8X0_9MAGN|nr:putative pectinesterase/pectinesterase inhibitor 24 [Cinnamomum micranthum f. kanehirae]